MNRLATLFAIILVAFGTSVAAVAAPDAHSDPAAAAGEYADGAHGDDHGAGHDPSVIAKPKEGIATAITAFLVFIIVLGILSTQVWPKISKGLDERNAKIQGEIAAAEEARKQARDALDEYERNLAEARAESQKMLEETRSQQAALASQLKSKADAELGSMREKALNDIETAKKQALAELHAESVNLATIMAGKILQREVNVQDQQRLMDESLAEMKAANA